MFKRINYGIKCDESRNFKGNQINVTRIDCVSEYRYCMGYSFSFGERRYQICGTVNGEHFTIDYTIKDRTAYATEQEAIDVAKTGVETVITKFRKGVTVVNEII